MTALGQIIRTRREKRGLTLRATGAAAGVSFVTIRDIERGHVSRPTQETLEGISTALGIPLSKLAQAAYAEFSKEAVT